jgi:hypothetical protein
MASSLSQPRSYREELTVNPGWIRSMKYVILKRDMFLVLTVWLEQKYLLISYFLKGVQFYPFSRNITITVISMVNFL